AALAIGGIFWFVLAMKTHGGLQDEGSRLQVENSTSSGSEAPTCNLQPATPHAARRSLRLLLWLLTHTFYRLRVLGAQNVPATGGALLVCNHLSHVDALLLLASTRRDIRFLMYKGIYERPYVKPLARIMGVIPISSEQRPWEMINSLRMASEAITR